MWLLGLRRADPRLIIPDKRRCLTKKRSRCSDHSKAHKKKMTMAFFIFSSKELLLRVRVDRASPPCIAARDASIPKNEWS